jgi:hypothetical protein
VVVDSARGGVDTSRPNEHYNFLRSVVRSADRALQLDEEK